MRETYIMELDQGVVSDFGHLARALDQRQDLQDEQDYTSNSKTDFLTRLVNPVNPVPFFLNRQQEIAAKTLF